MRTRALVLILAAAAAAQDVAEVTRRYIAQEEEAFGDYRRKDYAKAVAGFERQIAIFPDNPRPYYNIACCYALEGSAPRAATWLTLAIDRGWRDAAHLAHDPDFDRVRQSPDYIACLAKLKRAREVDPDPMPRIVPAPETPSLRLAFAVSQTEENAVRSLRRLYEQHGYRKRLFDVYDRRMAVLARYLVENGDAVDAPDAAAARVATASLYLAEAEGRGEPDRALREIAAGYVLRTVEEFLRACPGDPRLPGVLLARAFALRTLGHDANAIALLRTVRADHPAYSPNVDAELCALLPAGEELMQARARLGDGAPMRARLLCDGMPSILDLDAEASARAGAHEGLLAYVFVVSNDTDSEARLRALPEANARLLPVVVCLDEEPDEAWLKEHARSFPTIARGAAAVKRLRGVPTVVIVKDGTVLAIDPDDAELERLSR